MVVDLRVDVNLADFVQIAARQISQAGPRRI
jgi:hypothetical protein